MLYAMKSYKIFFLGIMQRAYVVCRLEYKPDEKGQKAGLPDFVKGEPSGEIMPDLGNPVASAAISLVR